MQLSTMIKQFVPSDKAAGLAVQSEKRREEKVETRNDRRRGKIRHKEKWCEGEKERKVDAQ